MSLSDIPWIEVGVKVMVFYELSGHRYHNRELQAVRWILCALGICYYIRMFLDSLESVANFALFTVWMFGGFEEGRESSMFDTLLSWVRQNVTGQRHLSNIVARLLTDGDMHGQQGLHCAVCQEAQHTEEAAAIWPCGHFLHVECTLRWLKEARTCPSCRNPARHSVLNTEAPPGIW